ncbi:MAG: EAL domain-containing protein [Acidobacteriota bacterium]
MSHPITQQDSSASLDLSAEFGFSAIEERRQQALLAQQVQKLYSQSLDVYALTFGAAAVTVAVLWEAASQRWAIPWLCAVAAAHLWQIGLISRWRERSDRHEPAAWSRRYVASLFGAGLIWGLVGIFLFPDSQPHRAFVAVILASVCGMIASTVAPLRWGLPVFALPAVVPFLTRTALQRNEIDLGITLAGLVLLFALGRLGLAMHEHLVQRERLRYDHSQLIDELYDTNEGLITQIEEREVIDTEYQKLEQELTYQASHDPVTGLPNRQQFEADLRETVADGRGGHALCILDLDQFKVINDTCGHLAGDELLRQLARLLPSKIRQTDMMARLGGDEFGVLLRHCPIERAEETADQLRQAIESFRFDWKERRHAVTASVGVVSVAELDDSAADLLVRADAACFTAKERGGNRVHSSHPGDHEIAKRQTEMQLVGRIRTALEQDRFRLRYQPIVDPLSSQTQPQRIEILVTMVDRQGNSIPPSSFIPAAERFNVMPAVDRWVIRETFERLASHWADPRWVDPGWASGNSPDAGPRIKQCFINLSGTSLASEDFIGFVKTQLIRHQIPRDRVCFEITETTAIQDLPRAVAFMTELREMGCSFALDDFGTGVSSFGYLRSLPVDFIKIDGAFVRDADSDAVDHAIVESIHHVATQLNLRTIAEFVESRAVVSRLMRLGIDLMQGYALARPAMLEELVSEIEASAAPVSDALPDVLEP